MACFCPDVPCMHTRDSDIVLMVTAYFDKRRDALSCTEIVNDDEIERVRYWRQLTAERDADCRSHGVKRPRERDGSLVYTPEPYDWSGEAE